MVGPSEALWGATMASFSVSQAFGEGFRLIGRRPLSVLAWGLAYLVVGVAPVVLVGAYAFPDLVSAFRQIGEDAARGVEPTSTQMLALQSKFMLFQPIVFLSSIAARAMLTGAIFRAVLEPEKRSFFSLRLGSQELWLAILMVALGVLAALFMVLLALPVGGITAMAAYALRASAGGPAVAAVICVGVIVYFVVVLWVALRFSLALPMTFAEREFRLFESWEMTKGQAGRLLGLALLLIVVCIAIGVVIDAVLLAVVFGGVGLSLSDQAQWTAFFSRPPEAWMSEIAPWAAVLAVIGCFAAAALMAILLAPWASAYQQLVTRPSAFGPAGGMPPEPQPPPDFGGLRSETPPQQGLA